MTATVRIDSQASITLPSNFCRQLSLQENDLLSAEVTEEGILLRPLSKFPVELYTETRIAEFEEHTNQALKDVFPDQRSGER